MAQNEETASFLKALGHPVRLGMAKELLEGEKSVGEIQKRLGLAQANTSQHLIVLRNSGVVESRRKGNLIFYYLKEPKKIRRLLETFE